MDKKTILNELNKIFIDDISEKIVDYFIFKPKTNEELQIAVDKWCEYKKGAKFEDELIVLAYLDEIPKSKLRINYSIKSLKSNETHVDGYTIHAFIKKDGFAIRAPNLILEKIDKFWVD